MVATLSYIKVFKFRVTNYAGLSESYAEKANKLYPCATEEEIENTINEFCDKHDVKNIAVTPVVVSGHNNGGGNTTELWYNITYNKTKRL